MCIDGYCTKGVKTIDGCFVCVNSSPKIPWYVSLWYLEKHNGLFCVYSLGKDTVCVKSTLTNDIVLLGNWTQRGSQALPGRRHLNAVDAWRKVAEGNAETAGFKIENQLKKRSRAEYMNIWPHLTKKIFFTSLLKLTSCCSHKNQKSIVNPRLRKKHLFKLTWNILKTREIDVAWLSSFNVAEWPNFNYWVHISFIVGSISLRHILLMSRAAEQKTPRFGSRCLT